jgi:hypothetical protein
VFSRISSTSGLATGELMGSSLNPYPSHAGGGIPRPQTRPSPATIGDAGALRALRRQSQTNLDVGNCLRDHWISASAADMRGRETSIRNKVFDEMSGMIDQDR